MKKVLAVAFVAAVPSAAGAVTVNQLEIVGNVDGGNTIYSPTGQIDFVGDASSNGADGIFASVNTIAEPGPDTVFTLFDMEFEDPTPQHVYSGGGFDFFAESFSDFDDASPLVGFSASGYVTTPFGTTLPAEFALSSQFPGQATVSFSSTTRTSVVPLPASVLLLISALGGLGLVTATSRRTSAA